MAGQRDFELELVREILSVISVDGFALAGGQAAIVSGIVDRPSEDLDLFTNRYKEAILPAAAERALGHLRGKGYEVVVDDAVTNDNFLRAIVQDAQGHRTKVELGYDYREYPSIQMDIGPVIDMRDFAAAKMNAFCGRDKVRDTIDLYGLLERGGFTEDEIVILAAEFDAGFHIPLLVSRLELEASRPVGAFEEYGVDALRASSILARMSSWATRLRSEAAAAAAAATLPPPSWGIGI